MFATALILVLLVTENPVGAFIPLYYYQHKIKYEPPSLLLRQNHPSARYTTTTTVTRQHNPRHAPHERSLLTRDAINNNNRNVFDFGMPSNPGWKSGRLNRLTDWAESSNANRPIICEYEPNGFWLWRKWNGTVLQSIWPSALLTMGTSLLFDIVARRRIVNWHSSSCAASSWPLLSVPPTDDPLIKGLAGLRRFWGYHLTIATFIVSFFTSQAFDYWNKVYNTSRKIQGRINDFCMLVVMGAQRKTNVNDNDNNSNNTTTTATDTTTPPQGSSGYTNEAKRLVTLVTRLVRMCHIFFWAATPTASNGLNDCDEFIEDAANCPIPIDDEHIGPLLLSPYGLKALVNSGQLTKDEADGLMKSGLPPSQYAYILLVWAGQYTMNGATDGTLRGGDGFEENVLRQLTMLRACLFDIDDFRAGRMPLAYVQLVQVLVDSLVMIAPFALYSELGSLSTPLVGLLTLFFRGLLVLSKSFLDPFGVEGFEGQNIRVDVLVSELNFGAAKRWIAAGGFLPPTY